MKMNSSKNSNGIFYKSLATLSTLAIFSIVGLMIPIARQARNANECIKETRKYIQDRKVWPTASLAEYRSKAFALCYGSNMEGLESHRNLGQNIPYQPRVIRRSTGIGPNIRIPSSNFSY